LKKSVDKLFELTIYAIFKCFLDNTPYALMVKKEKTELFDEKNKKYYEILFGVQIPNDVVLLKPSIKRAGVANAADRGLDMWCNFGPAVQVKHIQYRMKSMEKPLLKTFCLSWILMRLSSSAKIVQAISIIT